MKQNHGNTTAKTSRRICHAKRRRRTIAVLTVPGIGINLVAGLSYNQNIVEFSEVGGGRQTIFQRCRRGKVDWRGRWERSMGEVDRRG
jgi:hypothetical protein